MDNSSAIERSAVNRLVVFGSMHAMHLFEQPGTLSDLWTAHDYQARNVREVGSRKVYSAI